MYRLLDGIARFAPRSTPSTVCTRRPGQPGRNRQPRGAMASLAPSPAGAALRRALGRTSPWDLSARTLAPHAREGKPVGQVIGQREQVELIGGAARAAHEASGKLDHSVRHR